MQHFYFRNDVLMKSGKNRVRHTIGKSFNHNFTSKIMAVLEVLDSLDLYKVHECFRQQSKIALLGPLRLAN